MGELSATELVVTPCEGVDAELATIGQEYWDLADVGDDNRPHWTRPVSKIDTKGRGPAHILAAIAVRAEFPGASCRRCEQPLQLATRTRFEEVLRGSRADCVNCDEQLQDRIAQVVNPGAYKEHKRRAKQERQQHQAELEQRRREWIDACHEHLQATYRDELSPDEPLPTGGVRAELAALVAVRFAPKVAPITPIAGWGDEFPFYPADDGTATMLGEALRARLLEPHSQSSLNAFRWEKSFSEAYRDAGEDLDQLPDPQLSGRFYPMSVSWHVRYGPSAETAVKRLDEHLACRLDPANMTEQRQQDMLDVAAETLRAEAQRYFAHQLDYRKLPAVAENHQPRLDEAIAQLLDARPLGTAYYLAWLATKTAAAQAHSQPRIPKSNMTTHAVNRFQQDVQRACDDDEFAQTVFDVPIGCPLSAFTRTLFFNVLEVDPVKALPGSIAQHLPPPVSPATPAEDATVPSRSSGNSAFRTGGMDWFTFSEASPSQLLLSAGRFLAECEDSDQPPTITSLRWDTSDDGYLLTLYLNPRDDEA